ncbi:tripartite tricarboxylate transporter substrate binding protein [Cupriavidus sp. amp6]|uniref:tripartite tricarboxylate transporter substrate binding protein n=1 Tax=Cupriavidus sp. amp6 TaxID=388051 RepID=UPI0003F9CF95|nr:tripartite tricarboxylate transporter substrate binding protein [Cupriavidus sp. amp6]
MRRRDVLAAGLAAACTIPFRALGSQYPSKVITICHGFAVGGNADSIARVLAAELAQSFGQPVIVESRPGAGGTIAANHVARARPDGYTLMLATGGHAVAGALYRKLRYDPVSDFQSISTVTTFPFLLVVGANGLYPTLASLLHRASASPRSIAYGSAGIGSTHHLAMELLGRKANTELLHVPYRGDAALVTALLANEVPLIIAPPTAVTQHVKAGKLRVLATTGSKRWTPMASVPTVMESGVPGYEVVSWAGLMAPANSSPAIVDVLQASVAKALESPTVRATLTEIGGTATSSSPEQMTKLLVNDLQKWRAVVSESNIPKQ